MSDDTLHASLSRLVGTWRTEGRIMDGGEQHGDTWSGWDVYEWFPGERQIIHRVDVELFGGRTEAIEVFTPRAGSSSIFDQTSFDGDGTVERAVGSFDDQGRYHNDAETVRATLTFDGPTSMRAQWEMRRPDGEWGDWMEVVFTRVGEPHIEVRSKRDHTR